MQNSRPEKVLRGGGDTQCGDFAARGKDSARKCEKQARGREAGGARARSGRRGRSWAREALSQPPSLCLCREKKRSEGVCVSVDRDPGSREDAEA